MNLLNEQYRRFFFHLPASPEAGGRIDEGGQARAMLLCVSGREACAAAAHLYQVAQESCELPAPALAVSPGQGFSLWFPLAEPLPVEVAADFLGALAVACLSDMKVEWRALPGGAAGDSPHAATGVPRVIPTALSPAVLGAGAPLAPAVPALDAASGRWSAFIDPGLISLFADAEGLDLAPNPERQAAMLAGVAAVTPAQLARARRALPSAAGGEITAAGAGRGVQAANDAANALPFPTPGGVAGPAGTGALNAHYDDPRDFLRAVMNDPQVPVAERIRAASALLPYLGPRV